jgi:hypothetical protein
MADLKEKSKPRGRPFLHGERKTQSSVALTATAWGIVGARAAEWGVSLNEALERIVREYGDE